MSFRHPATDHRRDACATKRTLSGATKTDHRLMPIPTDTFWNIRRLNIVFAISAVSLVAVSGWAIKQDYEKSWRPLQQKGRGWEAALVDERVTRLDTPELERRVEGSNKQSDAKNTELER